MVDQSRNEITKLSFAMVADVSWVHSGEPGFSIDVRIFGLTTRLWLRPSVQRASPALSKARAPKHHANDLSTRAETKSSPWKFLSMILSMDPSDPALTCHDGLLITLKVPELFYPPVSFSQASHERRGLVPHLTGLQTHPTH